MEFFSFMWMVYMVYRVIWTHIQKTQMCDEISLKMKELIYELRGTTIDVSFVDETWAELEKNHWSFDKIFLMFWVWDKNKIRGL